jgi:hypothetical protein
MCVTAAVVVEDVLVVDELFGQFFVAGVEVQQLAVRDEAVQ